MSVTKLRNLISKAFVLKRGVEDKHSALDGLWENKTICPEESFQLKLLTVTKVLKFQGKNLLEFLAFFTFSDFLWKYQSRLNVKLHLNTAF